MGQIESDAIKSQMREQIHMIESELSREPSSWEFILMRVDFMKGLVEAANAEARSHKQESA